MLFGFSIYSILIIFTLFALLESLLFDLKKFGINSFYVLFCLLLTTILLILKINGIFYILDIGLVVFVFWGFWFGMHINRLYIYVLALTFLILVPILLIFKLENTAEFIAILSYFCLVLGVLKDIFYEKIFK